MSETCARTVCDNVATKRHPDGTGRGYCDRCTHLIEHACPELFGRFTPIVTDCPVCTGPVEVHVDERGQAPCYRCLVNIICP